jgi:FG-GAP-like repeat/FG-GAP repeat
MRMKPAQVSPKPTRGFRSAFCPAATLVLAAALVCPSTAQADTFSSLLTTYSNYDYDSGCKTNCIKEITSLAALNATDPKDIVLDSSSKLVVVLVEKRVTNTATGDATQATNLRNRLSTFKADLMAEGFVPRMVEANVYSGTTHQDGKTLLALRRFLKAVRTAYPSMQGAILVGSFPEAMLIREWIWQVNSGLQIIADLDGNWESIYNVSKSLRSIWGKPLQPPKSWPQNNQTLTLDNTGRTDSSATSTDFFYIKDDDYSVTSTSPNYKIKINAVDGKGPELATGDTTTNRIARPEIFVSRINARNVAVNPDPNFRDNSGHAFLDANGKPQTIQSTPGMYVGPDSYVPDLALERRLLLDYFDRNHRYRVGGYTTTQAFACVSFLIDDGACGEVANAALGSAGTMTANATLLDYVNWLKIPTTLRSIDAHSNPYNSMFGGNYADSALALAAGTNPWRWLESPAGTYVPSLNGLQYFDTTYNVLAAQADQFVDRTLWENGVLAGASPALYIHDGCQVNSPANASSLPYNDPMYARWQNAEGILFFLNGVSVMSRAKIFDDHPVGFGVALAPEQANFGAGWKAYFDSEATNAAVAGIPSDRKRSYNWSEIGDWTVRKRYVSGLAVVGLEPGTQSGQVVWNADTTAANATSLRGPSMAWDLERTDLVVQAVGDFVNDGPDEEFLVTSSWGLGLIDRVGSTATGTQRFQMLAGGPNGTQFGGWTYDAASTKFIGVGKFDSVGNTEILVSSSWGLAILRYAGNQLTSIMAKPNGTWFGGWVLNTADNKFFVGDFNGDGLSDILITSPWGIGIFELSGNTLAQVAIAQNGTSLNGWTVNTATDSVVGIGDFDGGGSSDILLRNSWGLGIVSYKSTGLYTLMAQPHASWFGGWHFNNGLDQIVMVADLDTDAAKKAEILIKSDTWIGVLGYANGTLTSEMVQPFGTLLGSWPSSASDIFPGVGDFNGDGKIDLVVYNEIDWTLGVLTLGNGTMTSVALQQISDPQTLLGNFQMAGVWVMATGDFDGDQKAEMLLMTPNDPGEM